MSRLNRLMLAIALFACTFSARADSLRVLTPVKGATLHGGSFAELRWTASQLPGSAEEWEAFLSLDGGKYYAFRITPHLDIELRRFTFIVPNVDTHDARILIRAGDEVHESTFESAWSFSIAHDEHAGEMPPALLQSGHGEAARVGDPAVVSWADGTRNGSGITHHSSGPERSASIGSQTAAASDVLPVLNPSGKARGSAESCSIARVEPSAHDRHPARTDPLPLSIDLLLVCRRRNI